MYHHLLLKNVQAHMSHVHTSDSGDSDDSDLTEGIEDAVIEHAVGSS